MKAETYSVKLKIFSDSESNPLDSDIMEWCFNYSNKCKAVFKFDFGGFREKVEEKSERSKRVVADRAGIFIGGAIAKGENTRSINKSTL